MDRICARVYFVRSAPLVSPHFASVLCVLLHKCYCYYHFAKVKRLKLFNFILRTSVVCASVAIWCDIKFVIVFFRWSILMSSFSLHIFSCFFFFLFQIEAKQRHLRDSCVRTCYAPLTENGNNQMENTTNYSAICYRKFYESFSDACMQRALRQSVILCLTILIFLEKKKNFDAGFLGPRINCCKIFP